MCNVASGATLSTSELGHPWVTFSLSGCAVGETAWGGGLGGVKWGGGGAKAVLLLEQISQI